jgi:hypothetical protein
MKDVCSNDPWGPFGPSGSVSWSSSNTAIATVSGQTITAVGAGSATITGTWSGDLVAYGYMCSPQYGGGGASATLQVLGPKKLVRFDYTAYSPGAPNGYGPLILTADTNNEVRNVKNEVKQTNQCGVYRNLVYELTDVNGTAITPAYSITEKFSNYQHSSSYTSGTTPSDFMTSISANGLVQDTMYLGKTLPSCLGPDDNESFDQSFVVTLNGTQYTLTTVNHVSRGRFAGVYKVDVTITTQ